KGLNASLFLTDYYYYDYVTESPAEDFDLSLDDWLYELLDITNSCDPNPCLNGGLCDTTADGGFVCSCPEPYTGKKCQTATSCRPNPCQNGGSCMKTSKRLQCSCPAGYTGKFCEVGPNDCYQGDGESYRGMVSETVEGEECLDWNSFFIVQKGGDPFKEYAGFDGIGPHSYCRISKGMLKCMNKTPPTPPVTDQTPAKPDVTPGQFSQCGRPQPGRSARIFGGKKSLPGAHPWQVSLQSRPRGSNGPFSHLCGGILLESCWVLTAAHCMVTQGGPLVCERNGTHYVVGVVSWGDGCGKKVQAWCLRQRRKICGLDKSSFTLIRMRVAAVQLVDIEVYDISWSDYEYSDVPEITPAMSDWLFELLNETSEAGPCEPNPCHNGGLCVLKNDTDFACACPEPYIGIRCQKVANLCGNVKCGFGDCVVNLNKHPYYECKCKHLYQGPDCKQVSSSPCEPNPCKNGGSCKSKGRRLRCFCQGGHTGKFCEIDSPTRPSALPKIPPVNGTDVTNGSAEFSQCGLSRSVHTSRIYGGSKSLPGAHPWQVSLQYRTKGSTDEFHHLCGGILISSCWVLTAAHCIEDTDEFQVVLGGVNIVKDEAMDQTIPVIETILHEHYNMTSDALQNDIGSYSPKLMNARVFLISDERCSAPDIYEGLLDSSMLCAGVLQGGIDSCQGDSGGPLICEQNGISYIVGVVSWGDGCGLENKPGVYANVYGFLTWIKSKIYS
ncbi:Hyaluronan-binding protein 2, partial [Nibea albiflora]